MTQMKRLTIINVLVLISTITVIGLSILNLNAQDAEYSSCVDDLTTSYIRGQQSEIQDLEQAVSLTIEAYTTIGNSVFEFDCRHRTAVLLTQAILETGQLEVSVRDINYLLDEFSVLPASNEDYDY